MKILIFVIISIFALQITNAQKLKPDNDFTEFWKKFSMAVIENKKDSVADFINFKGKSVNTEYEDVLESKETFLSNYDFIFGELVIKDISRKKALTFLHVYRNGDPGGYQDEFNFLKKGEKIIFGLFGIDIDVHILYFAKINGKYKMIEHRYDSTD